MIVGIDLGTTNSLAAVWRGDAAEMVPNALGQLLTPSVVGLDDQGRVLVGQAAKERLHTHPHLTTSLFKRYMGSATEVRLGDRSFRPEELSALVLKSLKEDIERTYGQTVTDAVISVPAYFSDGQRKATRIAGELAGLTVEKLINEPTAAALAYGLHQRDKETSFLVFDLGGGTFDVSIIELFDGVMEVRASAGDNFLGGEDFDTLLLEHFVDSQRNATGFPPTSTVLQALRREAERVRKALGQDDSAEFALRVDGQQWVTTITQQELQDVISNSIADPLITNVTVTLQQGYVSVSADHQRLNDASKTDTLSFRLDLSVSNGQLIASITDAQIDGVVLEQNRVDNWNQTIANRLSNFGKRSEKSTLQSVSITPEIITMTWSATRQ